MTTNHSCTQKETEIKTNKYLQEGPGSACHIHKVIKVIEGQLQEQVKHASIIIFCLISYPVKPLIPLANRHFIDFTNTSVTDDKTITSQGSLLFWRFPSYYCRSSANAYMQ